MQTAELLRLFQESYLLRKSESVVEAPFTTLHWKGLAGSSLQFYLQGFFKNTNKPMVLLAENKEQAAYYSNDLEQMLGMESVLFYPSSYRRPYQFEDTDNANILLRAEVLNRINQTKKPWIIVSYAEALFEKVVTQRELKQHTKSIQVGDQLSLDFLNEVLFEYDFKRVDFVSEPGEFSVRGGIVDVFSFSNDYPYRLEFFGNEIDSIRTFDLSTQLSVATQKKITIVPNIAQKEWLQNRISVLDYLPENTLLVLANTSASKEQLDQFYLKAQEAFTKLNTELKRPEPEALFVNGTQWLGECERFRRIELGSNPVFEADLVQEFHCKPQPSFNKQFEWLLNNLQENHADGLRNVLCCTNESQAARFHDIFESIDETQHETLLKQYTTLVFPLFEGFIDEALQIACYTDHQIFERYHKFQLRGANTKKSQFTLNELNAMTVGDYVTHIDHGIGRFGGLQKIQVDGKTQEAIKLVYADNDIVYVSIHALHKIAKFNGKDGVTPKIYKLGSSAWKALKQKTKARVKHIAFNLIQLYAKRRLERGFACAPDSYLQKELESSFIYEDTPDQLKATQDVKADMERDRPMDRLVCGDVGFGKTEVAIRAAFKAVDNGKQVAILVPTTILAYQHYRTFTERLKDMPVTVGYLNRFRTAKQKQETLKDLAEGKVDILIGTHQLVNKNVQYKELGLLIIDEEQKFGVNVKDKLKIIAHNVDTLTLTATPIPRTLQFSLMAARDLSVITTPPPNRYPIESQVIGFNEEVIRDAIVYELQRNGQVFFINNRIENIREVAGMIQRLVPDARVGIGHGQMEGAKLEELMLGFMNGDFDVLVATTIIESGLDVPNANTIFINQAHQFGLSDLHQMRGRVGRSNKKAFCYFICPPYSSMTEEARKRIQALEQYNELGSGFNIAMKDLEIRGAGDLLGAEQSGFMNDIGFETYQKIMNEAIEELKDNEFKELFTDENEAPKEFVREVQIDTDLEWLFPDSYINTVSERLILYNELNALTSDEARAAYRQRLIDRFGPLPKEAEELLCSMALKQKAMAMGIEKIILKQGQFIGYFIADQQSEYYQSNAFQQLLQAVLKVPNQMRLKEKTTKNGLRLLLTIDRIKSVQAALGALDSLGA